MKVMCKESDGQLFTLAAALVSLDEAVSAMYAIAETYLFCGDNIVASGNRTVLMREQDGLSYLLFVEEIES